MKVGEIVAAATTTCTAQSYELNRAPAFGSLLRVPVRQAGDGRRKAEGDEQLPPPASRLSTGLGRSPIYYALCSGAQTGAIEPGRHAVAWGRVDDDEADIYRRQPQLSQVLRTTFDALLVGYSDGGAVVQRVPAMPPHLHALVYEATRDEVALFNADLSYLRFVLRTPLPNADDFIAATIEHAQHAMGDDRAFLIAAARTVARLLGAEHERVMNILELLDG